MDRAGIRYHSVFGDRANTGCICEGGESAVIDTLQGERILLEPGFGSGLYRADFAKPQ